MEGNVPAGPLVNGEQGGVNGGRGPCPCVKGPGKDDGGNCPTTNRGGSLTRKSMGTGRGTWTYRLGGGDPSVRQGRGKGHPAFVSCSRKGRVPPRRPQSGGMSTIIEPPRQQEGDEHDGAKGAPGVASRLQLGTTKLDFTKKTNNSSRVTCHASPDNRPTSVRSSSSPTGTTVLYPHEVNPPSLFY